MAKKKMKRTRKIPKIGDKIKFTVVTREGVQTATRKVKGLWVYGGYTVGFNGWSEFIVKPKEVIEVTRAVKTKPMFPKPNPNCL